MKEKDRLYSLSCELMAVQKECNVVKTERDALAKRVSELQEIVTQQERLLDRAVQFRKTPRKKTQG